MLAKVHSGAVCGIDAYPVEIEVNEGRGDVPSPRLWNTGPQTIIVGLPDALRLRSGQAAVKGQSFDVAQDEAEQAKRAVEVAVAGGHNVLMIGPPGKAFIYNIGFWREVAA